MQDNLEDVKGSRGQGVHNFFFSAEHFVTPKTVSQRSILWYRF
jgi:hypothetical protein